MPADVRQSTCPGRRWWRDPTAEQWADVESGCVCLVCCAPPPPPSVPPTVGRALAGGRVEAAARKAAPHHGADTDGRDCATWGYAPVRAAAAHWAAAPANWPAADDSPRGLAGEGPTGRHPRDRGPRHQRQAATAPLRPPITTICLRGGQAPPPPPTATAPLPVGKRVRQRRGPCRRPAWLGAKRGVANRSMSRGGWWDGSRPRDAHAGVASSSRAGAADTEA